MDGNERGCQWWVRHVFVPVFVALIGSGGLIIVALITYRLNLSDATPTQRAFFPLSNVSIPQLVSPINGAVLDNGCDERYNRNDGITWRFSWYEVSGATKYHLYVINELTELPVIDDSEILSTSYTHDCPECYIGGVNRSDWEWRVRAFVNDSWSDWSNNTSFSVEPVNSDC